MKKNMKKFASLMLALVMAIGLAAPAFAAESEPADDEIDVSLQLIDENGVTIFGESDVSLSTDKTVYGLVTQCFPEPEEGAAFVSPGSEWDTYGNSMYLQTIKCGTKTYATVGLPAAPAGINVEAWYNGYGRVSYNQTTKEYTYIYAGYAWMYNVMRDGKPVKDVNELTMNQFELEDGDTVILNYKVQISEKWTTTEVLPGLGVTNA